MSSQIPTPGPRPTPGPKKPGAVARPAARVASDPAQWGRVAEDGSAYVRTADGERLIGVWQAGTPAEGLAHYGKRFDDLATEVALLEHRLKTSPTEAAHIREAAKTLRESVLDAAAIGDLQALHNRLTAVMDATVATEEKVKEEKEARRLAAIAKKEQLAAEAEEIAANSTDWKAAGDRLRDILTEWKQTRGADRKTDDLLWKRFAKARDSFNHRRGSHFADLDRARAQAKKLKEDLVARAEELKHSTDWAETSRAFRDLMDEWKAAGRAPREVDNKLWEAFRAAQDHFFNARTAESNQRDAEFQANADAKDALIAEYDPKINPENGLEAAREALRDLQEKWEEIGFVPRDRVREFEDKIEALEKRVSDAAEAQWRRTDPAAQARAAQFAAKAKEFAVQADAAEAKGNAKKAAELRQQAETWTEWAKAAQEAIETR